MFISRHQNAGRHNIDEANKCIGNVDKVKYLGTTVSNKKSHEIKSRLNSGNSR